MAKGLVKAKEYDWTDSNLAMFGSDTEKNVKKESAEAETAWHGAGKRVGLQIWRIVQFKVKPWPRNQYGSFYNGDSYIILNTYKTEDSPELKYDVHFWIGKGSTQDEYGTAAYKTVELDTYLDDKPVQHREVMGFESALFKSYFSALTLLEGGAESGFRHVKPVEYKPRLLRVRGTTIRNCECKEVTLCKASLDSADVFILDRGTIIYQWNGKDCDKDEKFRAAQVIQEIKSSRNGKARVETYDEEEMSPNHPFYHFFPNKAPQEEEGDYETFGKALYRLSDTSGNLRLSKICTGNVTRDKFNSKDVFIFDTGFNLFVWYGKNASKDEKKRGLEYGHNYLTQTNHKCAAITCLREQDCNEDFEKCLN